MVHPIKLARITAGMKQYDLAAQLGIAPSRLCMWENGRSNPDEKFLVKAAEILGTDVKALQPDKK